MTAELAGFRAQSQRITIAVAETRRLNFELTLAPLQVVDFVVPPAPVAFREADAVAHVRIEYTAPPGPCLGGGTSATHQARVLSLTKGELPPSIWFAQVNASACYEDGRLVRGFETPYQPGQEYIVFLKRAGELFMSVAGASTSLRIENGRVVGHDYPPILKNMTVLEVWSALKQTLR